MIEKIIKTEEEWKKILTPEQYKVMRQHETEPAFSCTWIKHGNGTYHCAACDLPLFESNTKFESGIGWPSYFNPINSEHILEQEDRTLRMERTELLCARCKSHLGHVFPDGPPPALTHGNRLSTRLDSARLARGGPTGKRYCINSLALKFKEREGKQKKLCKQKK